MLRALRTLCLAAAALFLLTNPLVGQSRLSVQGQPYFDGVMTLSLLDPGSPGEVPLLAYGITPLSSPLPSDWGPWYIGLFLNAVPLAPLDGTGRVDLTFALSSEDPAAVGIHIVVQAWVDGVLSNPASIPIAYPYFLSEDAAVITSPNPMQQANFGDRVTLGDLNDDGHVDIVVGAWFEDFAGHDKSGRVYIFWGPNHSAHLALDPVDPKPWGELGIGLTVADLNGDGVDDLLAAEDSGEGLLEDSGFLHIYYGNSTFPTTPSLLIPSPGTGLVYSFWGRALTAGDFNGDTHQDIAIGVDKATVGGRPEAGRVDVYWGPDFTTRVEVVSPDPAPDDNFGTRVTAGDVTGDGIDDLIESTCGDDVGGFVNIGSAHVFTGPVLSLFKTIPNPLPDGHLTCFGYEVHAADLDGDSLVEVITSDSRDRVFIFWSPSYEAFDVVPKPPASQQNPFGETAYGYALGAADINADGFMDVLIGDPFDGDVTGCPASFGGLLLGALGPYYSTFHRLADAAPTCGSHFGWSFAVGNMDGDSALELLVGSDTADDAGPLNSGHLSTFDLN